MSQNKLAQFLKDARNKAALTQNSVAEALGYETPQFVSNWERGISYPPIDALKKIARLYKVSEEELYGVLEEAFLEQTVKDLRRKFANSGRQKASK